ncbi:MAG: VWA domain-containing protein [Chloroflexota bacterium]
MANEIVLNCVLNVGTVPANDEPRLLYLLIDVRPGEGAAPLQAPVNLGVVIDVSESMRLPVLSQAQFEELRKLGHVNQTTSDGVPVWTFKSIPEHIRKQAPSNLEAVQASITQSAQHLEPGDRVSLVAFADKAQVLLSGLSGGDTGQVLDAITSLGQVKLGDETDIALGLESGLNEVGRSLAGSMVNRVLVLTDGFTRDPERAMQRAKQGRAAGISVSTIGIGTEFNEKLLVDMADASLGNAYFARTPAEIPPAFGQELAAVQSVVLRDVELEMKFSTGVEVRRAYRVRPAIASVRDARREGRAITVTMGDLDPANPPALLVECIIPTHSGGTFRIARVGVTHKGQNNERVLSTSSDVVVNYSISQRREEPNPMVMNTVERVTAYALQTRALNDMAAGNIAGATQKLRAAVTRLLTVGETDLAEQVQAEVARLSTGGEVSPESAKELRYATRRLTQRLD